MPSLAQKVFIQEMMGIHTVKANEAIKLYNSCLERVGEQREVQEDDLGDELQDANSMLRRYDMELTASMYDGAVWWGLVSTSRDEELARLSCAYSSAEMTLFRAISTEIQNTEEGCFPLVKAQLLSKDAKLTIAEGGRVIKRFADAMWLSIARKDGKSYVKYGPRSVLELPDARSYVRDQLGGLANDIHGEKAPTKRCSKGGRVERECVIQYRNRKSGVNQLKLDEVEENEAQEALANHSNRNRVNTRSAMSKHSIKRRRNMEGEEEDEIHSKERPPRRRRTKKVQQ